MSCGFTLEHYRELLDAARAGGYRFARFDERRGRGDLLLRHDVDLSLERRCGWPSSRREQGVAATYFLMTRAVFYNLASHEGSGAIAGCASSATASGCTPSSRDAALDERFDPSSPGTTPTPRT